jgi:O-antigen/teichoic acid export membrane protein
MVPALVAQVILPAFARAVGTGDRVGVRTLLVRSVSANAALGLGIAAALSAAGPILLRLYGADFGGSASTFAAVVFTAALVAIQTPIAQVLAATDNMWWSVVMNLGWAIVTLVLTAVLVDGGSLGVALARLLAYVVHSVWLAVFARRLVLALGAAPGIDALAASPGRQRQV